MKVTVTFEPMIALMKLSNIVFLFKSTGLTNQMDGTATSNINGAQIVEKTMLAPHPTSGNTINRRVQEREYTIRPEIAPV